MSSIAGLVAARLGSIYSSSKFAVVGLSKSAAIEYARSGIRINCVCPSFTDTPMVRQMTDERKTDFKVTEANLSSRIPLNRLGRDFEVARTAAWLLSDFASFQTGDAIPVAGGLAAL